MSFFVTSRKWSAPCRYSQQRRGNRSAAFYIYQREG
nr:MAG TPA: hypothetical protein [Caudoviricetes sp.]DAW67940.1 MAG TPA: hypothetical protein [Caudoviricetes sp.]